MNHIKFMSGVIEVYGEYKSDILESMTLSYVKERWTESELDGVFKNLILKISPKYGKPISPADFEEFFPRESLDTLANQWYTDLSNTGNCLDNVIISDIRAQKAIQAFGGWIDFCRRNPDYEGLHRKNFVENFIKYNREAPEEQPQILYGDSTKKFHKTPLMFGDKEQCKQFIEYSNNTAGQAQQAIENMTKEMRV